MFVHDCVKLFSHLSNFAIEHKPSAANVDEIIEDVQRDNPRFASMLRALSRMTVTPTMIHGGIKSNSVPESISMTADVRTLPHQDENYLRSQLDGIIGDLPGITYEIDYMAEPNSSDFETELAEQIKAATALALERDDINWVPAISTGFTDSRFTRPLNIVTYGFSGSHPDDDPMLTLAHGTNESAGIRSLISGTKIMLALACAICGAQ
ncbi:MAG: peptidase dimerization domain-containing protein [Chloroflexi bacterium]|nr:peptidase dimerization domain-containing protein [Chloroflexota bacterium]